MSLFQEHNNKQIEKITEIEQTDDDFVLVKNSFNELLQFRFISEQNEQKEIDHYEMTKHVFANSDNVEGMTEFGVHRALHGKYFYSSKTRRYYIEYRHYLDTPTGNGTLGSTPLSDLRAVLAVYKEPIVVERIGYYSYLNNLNSEQAINEFRITLY